jgi:nicotinamide mononucleotide transporter
MTLNIWLSDHYIEIFGAITGIIYVLLEIRQTIWLWPVGIITSAVYILVFFTGKLYADMSLQGYYLVISCIGWYWWKKAGGKLTECRKQKTGSMVRRADSTEPEKGENRILFVTHLKRNTGMILGVVFLFLFSVIWFILSRFTDSPVPGWDSFITSLSVVATWMLARKIYEHWYLWVVVNSVSMILFIIRGLYPTVVLYLVYTIMSFIGLSFWKRTLFKDIKEEL